MLKKLLKSRTTSEFRKALRLVQREFRIQRLHFSSVRKVSQLLSKDPLKLNVGCGPNCKEGWVNIDLMDARADLNLDLRESLPFSDDSVSIIYSEHFFEHLDYPDEVGHFLGECFRVLKTDGVFSIGVPDTEWPIRAFAEGDEEYFRIARERWHPEWCNTRMHQINYHFRQRNEHKYAYDYETLEKILRQFRFLSIERRNFNPELDSPSRMLGTLYVDARKPN